MNVSTTNTEKIAELLLSCKIGVLPTDTIYGLHCLWDRQDLVDKIARLKGRPQDMAFICILPTGYSLATFGITNDHRKVTIKYWPGPNTLIFDTKNGNTVALRTPDNAFLQKILAHTGPLVSTSANPHGALPAGDVSAAKQYFGNKVDFYVDGGTLAGKASSIYKIGANIEQIR